MLARCSHDGFPAILICYDSTGPVSNQTESAISSSLNTAAGPEPTTGGLKTATKTASTTVTAFAKQSSAGLDEGAKIGLGVGVSLGVLLCIVLLLTVYLFLRRRRIGGVRDEQQSHEYQEKSSKAELAEGSPSAELPGAPLRTELSARLSQKELLGRSVLAHELASSGP